MKTIFTIIGTILFGFNASSINVTACGNATANQYSADQVIYYLGNGASPAGNCYSQTATMYFNTSGDILTIGSGFARTANFGLGGGTELILEGTLNLTANFAFDGKKKVKCNENIASTKMFCKDTETIENELLSTLKKVDGYEIDDDVLYLKSKKQTVLTFAKVIEPKPEKSKKKKK